MRKVLFLLCCLCVPLPAVANETVYIEPCRILDTRTGSPLSALTAISVDVRGECGVPESAIGIVFNIVVLWPAGQGYLKVYGTDAVPATSIMNYNTGENVISGGANVELSVDDETTSSYDPPSWGVKILSLQEAHIVLDITAYTTRVATEVFRGFVTDEESGLNPPWTALEIDSLPAPLSIICQEPWADPAECDAFAALDEVCGTGHIGHLGTSPSPEIFVHTLTDCL